MQSSAPEDGPVLAQPRRKRAKHTRSRLGCGVCRIRRIRCDRGRPFCERCTKTGRKCDGYLPSGEKVPSADEDRPGKLYLKSRPPSYSLLCGLGGLSISLGPEAGRSLRYFQQNTALEIAGYFDSDLWSTIVLQISRREQCVQQMVVAIGLLHESFHHDYAGGYGSSLNQALRQQAIREYSVGIGLLNNHISTQGWANLEITLMCSILCVAFEWMRGDYRAAQTHLWSSLSILAQWHNKKTTRLSGTSLSSPSGLLIKTKLRPVCTSLVLQTRSMPINVYRPWHKVMDIRQSMKPFESLEQAKHSLDVLLSDALPETLCPNTTGQAYQERVWDLARTLTEWSRHFDAYLEKAPDERHSPPVTIMLLWHTSARILLTASLTEEESSFDKYLPEFSDIVERIEGLVSSSLTRFSVDIGVVPVLYYVAIKCRHPRVRRKALGMLREAPRREAVWDSLGAACVVAEVIRVEEHGLGEVCGAADVPGASRVCHMDVVTDIENRRIRISTMQQGSGAWSKGKILVW
ncbi:hypothetical protein B0T10DRAFT_535065 [Thelonectria olida]|uniref:Zn(2)-C6 fungal-type domain-containing protein n=1 Tax=Thelonectria olida TaxID=1576542 RepID=A0A9P8WDC8_9HYPO|nr:hypothetical protein B0T10DRAFT_535065 [Thelonectria olida]